MKRLIFPFLAMAALFITSGCSEKFKIAAPYKNITVVYAFLDQGDTAHYVRIQKAFLDENKNALVMSGEADSSFYSNLKVKMVRVGYGTTNVVDSFSLNRVDMGLEGYPKQPGQFFQSPNYAYKFKGNLDPT